MQNSYFFNSDKGDRRYNTDAWAEYFSTFIGNGVFPNPSTNLQILSANNGYRIKVGQGKAFINGYAYVNTSDLETTVEAAHSYLNRVDLVVLRLADRKIEVSVIKGEPASDARAPQLTRSADMYELALARVNVNKGVTAISQSDIVDLRLDKTYCGLVTNVVETVDATTLYNQYAAEFRGKIDTNQTQFEAWFNNAKGQMDTDLGTRLSEQISNLQVGIYRSTKDKNYVDATQGNWNLNLKGNTKYLKNGVFSDVWQEGSALKSLGDEVTNKITVDANGIISYIPTVLRKLNDTIFDEIQGGKLIKRVGKMVLDGSEGWMYFNTNENYAYAAFEGKWGGAKYAKSMADKLPILLGENWVPKNKAGFFPTLTGLGFVYPKGSITNLEDLKATLNSLAPTILFELETPVITDYSNSFILENDGIIKVEDTILPGEMVLYKDLDSKQEKVDSNLTTEDKSLVGAINILNLQNATFKTKVESCENNILLLDNTISAFADFGESYIKYENGVMECWVKSKTTPPINTPYGNMYINSANVNFPVIFKTPPTVNVDCASTGVIWSASTANTISSASFKYVSPLAVTDVQVDVNIHAVGRWK